ncbi:hypothetical protein A2U01_0074861, partial [Trifolium medium]|nr:hypothetical protein [Trifolium medium]
HPALRVVAGRGEATLSPVLAIARQYAFCY